MSQREGAPRSVCSRLCLDLISFVMCRERENEYQVVWKASLSHSAKAPVAQGAYVGHVCRKGETVRPIDQKK